MIVFKFLGNLKDIVMKVRLDKIVFIGGFKICLMLEVYY